MITLESVSVNSQSKAKIISNINLNLTLDKSVTAILGKNGAGKSTLAKVISQLISYDGLVFVDDKNLKKLSELERAALVTYCEELSPEIAMSVCDVLNFSRINEQGDEKYLEQLIIMFELKHLMNRQVSSLSGGERQRLSLACGFYQNSKIIILDEPTNYLDPVHVDNLIDFIGSNCTNDIIIISHDLNFLLKVAENFISIKDGVLQFHSKKRELIEARLLDSVFDKKFNYINSNDEVFVL